MRGRAAILTAKGKLEQINHITGSCGTLATSTPLKKRGKSSKEGNSVSFEKSDPIVAFSKPPPLPPFLGPLVVLSLLETFSSRDGNED
ncbi:hypothetical protein CDL15_Pgr028081 [Punica granatum]|uniref:Uncharacterized protein n=1 Tax=Punica granatum TaxID=22663 RepID=A0A218XK97_PUNGR|nr:hypothetical protein CDL15_Pgr028081 [Punica granatum]